MTYNLWEVDVNSCVYLSGCLSKIQETWEKSIYAVGVSNEGLRIMEWDS